MYPSNSNHRIQACEDVNVVCKLADMASYSVFRVVVHIATRGSAYNGGLRLRDGSRMDVPVDITLKPKP